MKNTNSLSFRWVALAVLLMVQACQAQPVREEGGLLAAPSAAPPATGREESAAFQEATPLDEATEGSATAASGLEIIDPAADPETLETAITGPGAVVGILEEEMPAEAGDSLPLSAALPDASDDSSTPPSDIWERIRGGMKLEGTDHPGIAREIAWFENHPAYLDRVADRAQPYMHFIVDELERREIPTEIALLPIVESAFQPFAYSHGRAAGIWQFVPGTGRRFGLKQTWWYDGRRDIARSTRAALDYLKALHKEFNGDWLLALAAYNSGEGTVNRAIRDNRRKGKPTDFWSLTLPRETEGYVPKLLAISAIVTDPAAHGIALKPIPDEPFLTAVEVGSQIDLDLAAEMAGITLEEMYRYNPAFNRWATDPDGPHTLLVPVENADQFRERLAQLPQHDRIQWVRHRIGKGETLGTIAEKYRTTPILLKSVNNIRAKFIRAGETLIIPVARKDLQRYRLSAEERLTAIQETPRTGLKIDYIVREGDSLWTIARAHDVSAEKLAKWNGMAPGDTLKVGNRLVIWSRERQERHASEESLTPVNFTHPHSASLRQRIGYTVRSGDSLATISQKFRVTIENLKQWNKLSSSRLKPGQRLTLYVDVTKQAGNT